MSDSETYKYPGQQADVEWDGRLCIHIGECVRAKGDLFVTGRQPWCDPDLASPADVADVVGRCPSGALSYRVKDGSIEEAPDAVNSVTVSPNGPYFFRGDLAIEGAPADMPGVAFRAALCRCGQSGNKPFCDNSHERVAFNDAGAIGEKGEVAVDAGGTLRIKPLTDGPLVLTGNLSIRAGSGREAWKGTSVALCRCGASNNKPFCDGTHKKVGFKSE